MKRRFRLMQVHPSPLTARWRLAVLLPALCCVSCSRSVALNTVHGKVMYKNQPAEGVVVTFHPKSADLHTVLPVGSTGADGTFTLSTGTSAGAPAGEYGVTFVWPRPAEHKGKKKTMTMQNFTPEDRLGGAYAKEKSSKITVEIKRGKNELEPFNLQ
jgi:hypothetical protein